MDTNIEKQIQNALDQLPEPVAWASMAREPILKAVQQAFKVISPLSLTACKEIGIPDVYGMWNQMRVFLKEAGVVGEYGDTVYEFEEDEE